MEIGALRLIHAYSINRKQRVKVNEAYSSRKNIIFGVCQGSILGPLFFNIHFCGLFYFLEDFDVASYADDTTIYTTEKNKESVIAALETSSAILFKWFNNIFLKANNVKSHLLISCKEPSSAIIEGSCIKSSQKELLLGVTIDNELKFDDHINYLWKNAWQKLNALARTTRCKDTNKKRTVMKVFVEYKFSCCPFIWMFHSRGINSKINHIHERALRITFIDKSSTFQELLDKDNSVTIHHRNIRALATEIYKVLHGYSPAVLNEMFLPSHCKYNFHKNDNLERKG